MVLSSLCVRVPVAHLGCVVAPRARSVRRAVSAHASLPKSKAALAVVAVRPEASFLSTWTHRAFVSPTDL
jgi:hypothetical protein